MGYGFRVTDATLDVLELLLGADQELYGLKIAKATGRPTGSVFPILARLEQVGWVTSEWESGDPDAKGPRRRFYRLSGAGLPGARDLVSQRRPSRKPFFRQPALTPVARIGETR
jgi:PadR family transcriptional regulator, regulatory protein PadR